jgi:rhamnose utilization protein RhaD (predicted bifunctional aldolase and dehydrogenase)
MEFTCAETATGATKYLQNLWTSVKRRRSRRSPLALLRYRSNLLGADLRITNFGGGNTSSKFERRSADRAAGTVPR